MTYSEVNSHGPLPPSTFPRYLRNKHKTAKDGKHCRRQPTLPKAVYAMEAECSEVTSHGRHPLSLSPDAFARGCLFTCILRTTIRFELCQILSQQFFGIINSLRTPHCTERTLLFKATANIYAIVELVKEVL